MSFSCIIGLMATQAHGQIVRTKRPDRGSYQPPVLEPVTLEELDTTAADPNARAANLPGPQATGTVRPVGHSEIKLIKPEHTPAALSDPILPAADALQSPYTPSTTHQPILSDHSTHGAGPVHLFEPAIVDGGTIGTFLPGDGCDDLSCDAIGGSSWANSRLRFAPDQWFGRLELLLLFRRGDRPPSLVTTGPDEANAGSEVLVGGDLLLQEVTAGGRLTLGAWLDDCQRRSLVVRGWTATEADFSFTQDQTDNAVLGRPFFNVTDGEVPADDVNLIASPGIADGTISVNATSNVFGADVSIRQPWLKGLGATVDVLYGYQYVRLTEDLSISSSVVSLDDALAPVGAQIDISDEFDTDNDFHGGQIGLAGRYREGWWSFDGLIKVGFGALRRAATRRGTTVTTIDGISATDPNGLLVRSTNAGVTSDSTFAWVPEVDLSIGYRRFKNFDITFGYNLVVLTDALQVSGSIDPNLASNLADPPLGAQNPSPDLRFGTFFVQGIHFGIQTNF